MRKGLLTMLPIALLVLVISCSKNQKKVNNLNGAWTLHTVDGVELEDDKVGFIFDQCILRNKEYCDVRIYESDTTINTGYKITNKGETLVIEGYVIPYSYTNATEIVELTDETMTLSSSAFGNTVILQLER